ncbi:uncharacterized protein LOC128855310 isoform X1 [Anastrepha ludens]|uniref:uncharacterized protein LOC128855310 isoform X1 n=1 Tax=Anastrepha ludens TaxID=28586 RepID=UPI0023B0C625|nr:uncharacterized protein LOC128855310 isoform X1 [Anastrepha ludens]
MPTAKMKTTPPVATTATTDANERIRKQQQQQQNQDDNIANNFASPTAGSTNIPGVVTQLNIPAGASPSTSTSAVMGAPEAASAFHGGRRNHTRKLRSASGDALRSMGGKRPTSMKRKHHVNFVSPISKSKLRLTTGDANKQLINKTKSRLNASNANAAASLLPPMRKSKSILKVKQTVVVKRKPGTGKISKRLKRVPQGAQAELEAAELSKLAKQFARKLPDEEETTNYLPPIALTPGRSNRIVVAAHSTSVDNKERGASKQRSGSRMLKRQRRHSVGTKHLPSGAGVVESGSVNVPAVRRFSPVQDKLFPIDERNVKVYDGTLGGDSTKSFDIPTTSNNFTVAMVKEEHAKTTQESNEQQQLPEETTNISNTTTVETVTDLSGDNSGNGSGVGGNRRTEEMHNSIITPVVVPIADPAARSTSNNSSPNKRKINEESAAKTSTEAATAAGPSTSSQPAEDDKDKEEDKDAKKKKNRCAECRKKVGLTGFQCRCGGLYCAVHRYSDKHDCTFNYREHGAQEIRRNNPVVVGEKIQKI